MVPRDPAHGFWRPARGRADRRYQAQTPEERSAFERQWGINQQAAPEVGEAVTVGALQDSPTWTRPPPEDKFYHWHFATCVLKSGHDYITLENYAGNQPEQWYFSMFGPAAYNQSFYQQETPSGVFGSETVGIVVQPAGHARLTLSLTTDADTLGESELVVRLSGPTGAASSTAAAASMGSPAVVTLPLQGMLVAGESQDLWLDVFDEDLLSDEHLLSIPWHPPYAPARYSDENLSVVGEIVP